MTKTSIVWLRQDLRITDNLAIVEAAKFGNILLVYIFDDCAPTEFKLGIGSKTWLHYSLKNLSTYKQNYNSSNHSIHLNIYKGNTSEIIENLLCKYDIYSVFWNVCYEPWHIDQQNTVQNICEQKNICYKAFNSNYLWNPAEMLKDDGDYYKVFTPYKKKAFSIPPRKVVQLDNDVNYIRDTHNTCSLSDLNLLPQNITIPWASTCKAGQAQEVLNDFITTKLEGYKIGRDYPGRNHTSILSPYLHFGEISPNQIWHRVYDNNILSPDIETFLNELIWREFGCYLLYHLKGKQLKDYNIKHENNPEYIYAWQNGITGYPIVDAGMRQLQMTGYMHNRVRMITASFLVKNLNIHWHIGRDWFWNYLADADFASNTSNWQWVAGCGADAAPYFRIFNPVRQGEKFDENGDYTRQFVPELSKLPNEYLFKPWTAPKEILDSANITLAKTNDIDTVSRQIYPRPIIDLIESRDNAIKRHKPN